MVCCNNPDVNKINEELSICFNCMSYVKKKKRRKI